MWLLRCLSPRSSATATPELEGTRRMPRETAPVDSAKPDLGDGGGWPACEVCTLVGPAADSYTSPRRTGNQSLVCTFACTLGQADSPRRAVRQSPSSSSPPAGSSGSVISSSMLGALASTG